MKAKVTKPEWIKDYKKLLKEMDILSGGHNTRKEGMCVMEAVSWLRGQNHSASPKCVSPIITTLMIHWNDSMDDDKLRNTWLKPLIPVIVGTKTNAEAEKKRKKVVIQWAEERFGEYSDEVSNSRRGDYEDLFFYVKESEYLEIQGLIRKLARIKS